MKKFGVMVRDLGASQLNYYLVRKANVILAQRTLLDITLFIDEIVKPCMHPMFAVMQSAEAFGYDGTLIATSFASAAKLLRLPCASRKLFYVWDLEWARMRSHFDILRGVYGNLELELLARSKDHQQVIQNAWNRPARVIDDFDWEGIVDG